MKVDIKPADSVLRVFEEDSKYGDKYVWSCSVKKIDDSTWEIMGVLVPPSPDVWRAMRKYVKENNITVIFKRIKDGKERIKIIEP